MIERKDTQGVERAQFNLRELKFADDGAGADEMTFSGYGAYFGNVDSYGDVIEPGAFAKAIKEARKSGLWPAMLMQHGGWAMNADDLTPVGLWVDMVEDDQGLMMQGKLADTQRGREAYGLLKMTPRPAISGLSIGYRVRKSKEGTKPDEPRRTLLEVELVEVSLVTFPANPKAKITTVKSEAGLTIQHAEEALREAGFSRNEAKAIVAKGFKAIGPREAADHALTDAAIARALAALK